jgi:hypothetical protein
VTKHPDGHFDDATGLWVLTQPWVCETRAGYLAVRPGFTSDGASVPSIFWAWVSPRYDRKTFAAAFAHDALYAGELCLREIADWTFYDILRERCPRWKAALMTWAVRKCGGVVWDRHTDESIEAARKLCCVFQLQAAADAWSRGEMA